MSEKRLQQLMQRHARLDREVAEENRRPMPDEARLARLKKLKLALKDEIATIQSGGNVLAA